jgi:hypothetical protein
MALDDVDYIDPMQQLLFEIVRDHAPAPPSRYFLVVPVTLVLIHRGKRSRSAEIIGDARAQI